MDIIDSHAHPPRRGVPGVDERVYCAPATLDEREALFCRDVEALIQEMDERGVAGKVMMAMPPDVEPAFHYGEAQPGGFSTYTSHEWIAKAAQLYPKRLFPCACLNPLLETACEQLEDLVENKGFLEVKLHNGHDGFMANDKQVYPFYRKCIELDIPVAFHTGFSPIAHIDRYIPTMPHALDELAHDLPELKIVMCHAGGNWYQDGVMIAQRNTNIMVDFAGIPDLCRRLVFPEVKPETLIRRFVEVLGADRVMYGTDNMDAEMGWDLMERTGLTQEVLELVMGENARRFLQLPA